MNRVFQSIAVFSVSCRHYTLENVCNVQNSSGSTIIKKVGWTGAKNGNLHPELEFVMTLDEVLEEVLFELEVKERVRIISFTSIENVDPESNEVLYKVLAKSND